MPNPPSIAKFDLTVAWEGLDVWKILQTGAPDVSNFLHAWTTWRGDLRRPRVLHYVAISPEPPTVQKASRVDLPHTDPPFDIPPEQNVRSHSRLASQVLAAQLYGLTAGFHRLSFEGGRVLLTLCIGMLKPMLRAQNFVADIVLLLRAEENSVKDGASYRSDGDVCQWDHWAVKSLARCCRRHTAVTAECLLTAETLALGHAGFEISPDSSGAVWKGRYNPAWEPKTNRRTFAGTGAKPATCIVVGAGLAGASVAASLARRGWQVTVLDSGSTPAAGASGLPVGLMMPHVSADDSPRSRLSRSGLRMMHQEAQKHLTDGVDWAASGVLERRLESASEHPERKSEARDAWSKIAEAPAEEAAWRKGLAPDDTPLWHARGAWVKPARLVHAWLSEPGVTFTGNSPVGRIEFVEGLWVLRGHSDLVLGQASHVVLATAMGTVPLLANLALTQPELLGQGGETSNTSRHGMPVLRGVAGQVSWGTQRRSDSHAMPPFPVNGSGSLIPSVPMKAELSWFVGATYEPIEDNSANNVAAQHQANLDRLSMLLPAAAHALHDQFESGNLGAWRNIRCTSPNRLPVVGPLMPGPAPTLWICTALGSRGLSLSALCAELLVARLGGEPWPLETSLAASLRSPH